MVRSGSESGYVGDKNFIADTRITKEGIDVYISGFANTLEANPGEYLRAPATLGIGSFDRDRSVNALLEREEIFAKSKLESEKPLVFNLSNFNITLSQEAQRLVFNDEELKRQLVEKCKEAWQKTLFITNMAKILKLE